MPCRLFSISVLFSFTLFCLIFSGCDVVTEDKDYVVTAYDGPTFGKEDVSTTFTAEIASSEVVLRSSVPHETGYRYGNNSFVITLKESGGELPTLTDVWYGPEGGGVGEVLSRSRVEIQDWDTSSVISGVLRARIPTGMRTAEKFWIDVKE